MQHYSQMTTEELLAEIEHLKIEENDARRSSMIGKEAIIQQKIRFARSYLVDPHTIQTGGVYHVDGEDRLFQVESLKGVMAWGTYQNSRLPEAVPIGILSEQTE